MTWFPMGPDFVSQPRTEGAQRFSWFNWWGGQGRVDCLAFEHPPGFLPGSPAGTAGSTGILEGLGTTFGGPGREGPQTIYATVTDNSGQCAAFRRSPGTLHWKAISDVLRRENQNVDPSWIAINPHRPNYIYMGTFRDAAVYVSGTRGDNWGIRNALPAGASVKKIIVDPRPVASIANTILYAATASGIYRSDDNGNTWAQLIPGNVWSFSFGVDGSGNPHFYAGIDRSGVWYASVWPVAASSFTLLNGRMDGLPAYSSAPEPGQLNFSSILVECVPANPRTAYAWFTRTDASGIPATVALYRTINPAGNWEVASAPPSVDDGGTIFSVNPYQGFDNYDFRVAPNSPGDGRNDILLFGNIGLSRSTDSGFTWNWVRHHFHNDSQSISFYPEYPASGIIPATYYGNDGGIGIHLRLCDRSFDTNHINTDADYNIWESVNANPPTFYNFNAGLENNLIYCMAHAPDSMAHTYIGCVDTGTAVSRSTLGWRGFGAADTFRLSAGESPAGISLASDLLSDQGTVLILATDQGGQSPAVGGSVTVSGFPDIRFTPTSNLLFDSRGRCLAGGTMPGPFTTLTADSGPSLTSNLFMPVADTSIFTPPCYVRLGITSRPFQEATVQSVSGSRIEVAAPVYRTYPAGDPVYVLKEAVLRADSTTRIGNRISQYFDGQVRLMARSISGSRLIACIIEVFGLPRFYRIAESLTEGAIPDWPEFSDGLPATFAQSMMISASGDTYLLLERPITASLDGSTFQTALYRLRSSSSRWTPLRCPGLPSGSMPDGTLYRFRSLVEHPGEVGTFFTAQGGKVFRLSLSTSDPDAILWSEYPSELPGAIVTEIWAGNIAPPGRPAIYMLRAATMGRGVWEKNITVGHTTPEHHVYMRRHLLDKGWDRRLTDGLINPYVPSRRVWHWEAADIKVEVPVRGTGGLFFQTDPVVSGTLYSGTTTSPGQINHVQFDLIQDFTEVDVTSLRSERDVRVHAHVQNRSHSPLNSVRIWALYTRFSGVLPPLNSNLDGTAFDFWRQFRPDGSIESVLNDRTSWKPLSAPMNLSPNPVLVNGLDVNNPKTASFPWRLPAVTARDSGHHCIAIFIHSAQSPIGETTRFSLDEIVMDNPQVCHKNVEVRTVSGTIGGGGTPGGGGGMSGGGSMMDAFIMYFHPLQFSKQASALEWDLSLLPPDISAAIQFPKLPGKSNALKQLKGISEVQKAGLFKSLGYSLQFVWDQAVRGFGGRKGQLPPLHPRKYIVTGGKKAMLDGLQFDGVTQTGMKLTFSFGKSVNPGENYPAYVFQKEDSIIKGGSTILVKTPSGEKQSQEDASSGNPVTHALPEPREHPREK